MSRAWNSFKSADFLERPSTRIRAKVTGVTAKTWLKQRRHRGLEHVLGVGLALAATCQFACATYNAPPACNNPFTPQQEVTEGAKIAAEVYQQMPVLAENDPVSQYVAQLGAHLVSHAPGLKWPFTFHVVASPDINAFALPGGAVFVNLGTVQAAETEAQLAGVMAHEISHVVLRHSTCNMKKQQTTKLLAGVGSIASQIFLGNGAVGQIGQAIIGGGSGLYGLRMSRDDEKQADLLGTDILYNSGYDPRGLPQFFEIIQAKYGSGGTQLLTDHPNPGNRTQYVNAEIATLPQRTNAMVSSAAFSRMHSYAIQERVFTAQQVKDGSWKSGSYASGPGQYANGRYGTNGQYSVGSSNDQHPSQQPPDRGQYPTDGQTGSNSGQYGEQGPVPLNLAQLGVSTRMNDRRGRNFRMNVPASWQATAETNGGTTLAPVGGSGAFGLVYGAVIGTAQADGVTDEDSLTNATQQLAQQISKQNGGLRQISQIQTLNVNGRIADGLELRGRSPLVENGTSLPERDWLIVMPSSDGDLHYVVFVSPERDFVRLRPTFVAMINSFRPQ